MEVHRVRPPQPRMVWSRAELKALGSLIPVLHLNHAAPEHHGMGLCGLAKCRLLPWALLLREKLAHWMDAIDKLS